MRVQRALNERYYPNLEKAIWEGGIKKKTIAKTLGISEKTLLTLAFMGGSISMLISMKIIHHKGKKFKNVIPLLTLESFLLLFMLLKIID